MNAAADEVTVQVGAARVTMPATAAVRAFLASQLNIAASVPTLSAREAPAIGMEWAGQGGIYAGLVRGSQGEADYHLVVGEQAPDELSWEAAKHWASERSVDGHVDFELPRRKEQAVMFGNVPELFQKTWYWSGEQSASSSDSAWCQYFGYGTQGNLRKDTTLRARAVRRLVIE